MLCSKCSKQSFCLIGVLKSKSMLEAPMKACEYFEEEWQVIRDEDGNGILTTEFELRDLGSINQFTKDFKGFTYLITPEELHKERCPVCGEALEDDDWEECVICNRRVCCFYNYEDEDSETYICDECFEQREEKWEWET